MVLQLELLRLEKFLKRPCNENRLFGTAKAQRTIEKEGLMTKIIDVIRGL